jgi:Ca-activated chloride channel homolog
MGLGALSSKLLKSGFILPAVSVPALILLFLGVGVRPQLAQERPSYSVAVNLIKVPVTVFDEKGGIVTDLRSTDFRLYEDGVLQDIRSFGVDRNPVSVVLLMDTSATVEKEMKNIKTAAEGFTSALSNDDRVSIITFGDEAKLVQNWTDDEKKVRKTLRKIEPGLRTALYDGMYMAAHDQLHSVEGRKAIILLTDCLNNQSSVSFPDASLAVVQSQASLYVVSKTVMVRKDAYRQRRVVMLSDIYRRLFGNEDYIQEFFQKREDEMTSLAEKTGGRIFFPTNYDQIPANYADVAQELKNQYFLTYVSNLRKSPNTYHEITLEYLGTSSRMTYRRGYYFEPRAVHKRRY